MNSVDDLINQDSASKVKTNSALEPLLGVAAVAAAAAAVAAAAAAVTLAGANTLANQGSGGFGSYIFLPTPSLAAHFLSKQIVPASLILESILQNTVLTIYTHFSIPKGVHALIFKIEMDLKNSVQLNEQIKIVSKIENISRGIISATTETHSGSKLISKANLKYWCPEADNRK